MFDFINKYMRTTMKMKDLPRSDTLGWKIIVYIAIGLMIFVSLQVTRILFTNSMVFVVASIILTVLLIYFIERYIFSSSKSRRN